MRMVLQMTAYVEARLRRLLEKQGTQPHASC